MGGGARAGGYVLKSFFLGVTLGICWLPGFAYTSIAIADAEVFRAFYRTSNYDSQTQADTAALEGCRVEARRNGIAHLASKCKAVSRAKGPGYGSLVCGENGCQWAMGYESGQAAVDVAHDGCASKYKNSRSKDIE